MKSYTTAIMCIAAAFAAGCGSNAPHRVFAPKPKLPRVLASQLATLGDTVAQQLDIGDSCAALRSATELQSAAQTAVASGEVPTPLATKLERATTALAARIQCVTPPAPPGQGDEHGHGNHKGHDGGGD